MSAQPMCCTHATASPRANPPPGGLAQRAARRGGGGVTGEAGTAAVCITARTARRREWVREWQAGWDKGVDAGACDRQ